jgi:RES domain
MPFGPPPEKYSCRPNRWVMPAGTTLWRVHHMKYGPADFNKEAADRHFGGGRFDATDDAVYPFLYGALADTTAVAETLLRDLAFPAVRKRTLPRKSLSGRRLSSIETTTELHLVSLISGKDLAAVKQDTWLIHSEAKDYAFTRRWAHWLRDQAPWAQGFVWNTRRELGELAAVLFGDRCSPGALRAIRPPGLELDDAAGASQLNAMLGAYDVHVYPPRPTTRPAGSRAAW